MSEKGYTLIETLVYISISCIIVIFIVNLHINSIILQRKFSSKIELIQQAIFIEEFVKKKMEFASDIYNDSNNLNKIYIKDYFGKVAFFRIDKIKNKIFYSTNLYSNGYEVGDYISEIKIEKEKDGTKVVMKFVKNKSKYNINFMVKMRNYY